MQRTLSYRLLLMILLPINCLFDASRSRSGGVQRRLVSYFEEVTVEDKPIRHAFRSKDEFTYLNHHFNKVMATARYAEKQRLAQ